MRGQFWKRKTLFVFVCFAGAALWGSETQAQQAATLPAGWQQMSPTDFATAIRSLRDQGQFNALSQADKNAVEVYGKQLFLQVNLSNTALNYQTLEMLHWVCRFSLPQSVIDQTRTALLARQDSWSGQPYAEVRAKVMMMANLQMPTAVLVSEARRWVAAGGTLAQVPQADLKFDIVRQALANLKVISGSFSVQWKGMISAPQSGDYTFFISPINVNVGYLDRPIKLVMTVSVAGQLLLASTPVESDGQLSSAYQAGAASQSLPWTSQSKSVTLTAGTPAAILVTLTVDAPLRLPISTLHAMLYWQGPGVSKSIVPTSSLSLPDGSGRGLQATYTWTSQGQPQTLTRTDPTIDFAWTTSAILLAPDLTIASQTANAMWQSMTSASFLASLSGPPVQLHPFIAYAEEVAAGLSSSQREAFCDLLLQNPTLLDAVDARLIVRFYQAFRLGAPGKALDVFGAWAARHANLACEISSDREFDGDMHFALSRMAIFTTQQLPENAARLQNEYLQLPNGQCALPVAYTLTYSYLGRHKLAQWVAFLDAKLADPTLTGDVRVNWLLARAHAQEHRQSAARHYPFRFPLPASRPLDSRRYLHQALEAAQSPQVKVRVVQEILARLAWSGQYQAAKDLLSQVANSLPAPQKAIVAAWQQQFDGFVAAYGKALQNRSAEANRAYLATLRSRRNKAAGNGDTASASRYDALINAAMNKH